MRGFVPGHIYIPQGGAESCPFGPLDWINEVDPSTGQWWTLATQADGLCGQNGLTFAPDGKRLRVLNWSADNVIDIDPTGNTRVVYDYRDGICQPLGANGIAFDADGFCYVSNHCGSGGNRVLKLPIDGGPAIPWEVVELGAQGSVFVPSGDLFAVNGSRSVLKIRPDGSWNFFDQFEIGSHTNSITSTVSGDIIVVVYGTNGGLYRYRHQDAATRELISDGAFLQDLGAVVAVAPNQRVLYLVDFYAVYAYDMDSGESRIILEFPSFPFMGGGAGIAVYWPPAQPGFVAGDVNCDGTVNQFDVTPFIAALTSRDGYDQQYPECLFWRADVNTDGSVNPFDIQPFVELLTP